MLDLMDYLELILQEISALASSIVDLVEAEVTSEFGRIFRRGEGTGVSSQQDGAAPGH